MTAKPASERVAALRERAAALGLKRQEIYAHPADWPAIKALAEKLQRRRELAEKMAANATVQAAGGALSARSPGTTG